MKRETYLIVVTRPDNVSVPRMSSYIRDAVSSWGGQFEPPNEGNYWEGDPLYGGAVCPVTVKRLLDK